MKKIISLILILGLMMVSMVACFPTSEETETTTEAEVTEPETTKKVVDKYDKYREPATSQTQEETTAPAPNPPVTDQPSGGQMEGFGESFDWEEGTVEVA